MDDNVAQFFDIKYEPKRRKTDYSKFTSEYLLEVYNGEYDHVWNLKELLT